ncbi:MAG: serpin family protein, partial [Ornithinimicrobium sp.]
AEAEPQPVVIKMPIVDAKSKLDLLGYLSDHAPSARSGGFGPMGSDSLFIDQAWQQGVLKVNEEGTVAAALTEIGFNESASMGINFTVDRPYLIRTTDAETGWPLFFSHITDPRADD